MDLELLDALRKIIREETAQAVQDKTAQIVRDEIQLAKEEMKQDLSASMNDGFQAAKEEIKQDLSAAMDGKLQLAKKDIIHEVTVLMDTEFSRGFNLLNERLDEILCKMPSEEDMDIIFGRLQEHDDELKTIRQEIAELK